MVVEAGTGPVMKGRESAVDDQANTSFPSPFLGELRGQRVVNYLQTCPSKAKYAEQKLTPPTPINPQENRMTENHRRRRRKIINPPHATYPTEDEKKKSVLFVFLSLSRKRKEKTARGGECVIL